MPSVSGNVGAVASVSSVFGRNGGVVAANGDYSGVVAAHLTGATAATRYVGGTASGAPVAGTFAVGDFVIEQTGKVYICTVAGTPGTWVAPGGGSSVLLAQKTLAHADILALPTTPFEIIAAPPMGSIIVPIHGLAVLAWTADYTNLDANGAMGITHLNATFLDDFLGELSEPTLAGFPSGLLANGSSEFAVFPARGSISTDISTRKAYAYNSLAAAQSSDGQNVVLAVNNGAAGNYTGGDAANKLLVAVTYYVLTLPT